MKENNQESTLQNSSANAESVSANSASVSLRPPAFNIENGTDQVEVKDEHESSSNAYLSSADGDLPPDLSAKIQSILGFDPNQINIHTNSSEASALGANAFTRDMNIYFAPGKFNTASAEGQKLIAHEMAHFTQQGVQATTEINGQKVNDDESLEKEADQLAEKVVNSSTKNINNKVNNEPASQHVVQRDPKEKESKLGFQKAKGDVVVPRQKFEYNYELKKKGNVSGSIRLAFSPKTSLAKVSKEYIADLNNNGKGDLKTKGAFKFGETKAALKHSGKSIVPEISAAVGAVEIGTKPFEWLTVKGDMKALEGKMKFTDGKPIEISALKFSVSLSGKIPKEYLKSIGIDDKLVEQYSVSLTGKIEYKVPPEDLIKLARFLDAEKLKLKHSNARGLKKAAQKKFVEEIGDLKKKKQNLQKITDTKSSRARNRLRRKLGKEYKGVGPEDAQKRIKDINKKLAEKAQKIVDLQKNIKKHSEIIEKAERVSKKGFKGLRGKSSRLIASVGKRIAAKVGSKFVAMLIPGLNILSTIADVIEISKILYQVNSGKMKIGGQGGDKPEDGKKGDGEKGGGEKPGGDPSNEKTKKPTGSGKNTKGKNKEGKAGKGTADIDLNDKELWEDVKDPYEGKDKVPTLHPNAKKVYESAKGVKGKDTQLTPEKAAELNSIVPKDFNEAQIQALLDKLKRGTKKSKDIDYFLGKIMQEAHKVKTGEKDENVITEIKPIDYVKAGKANKSWAKRFGYNGGLYNQNSNVSSKSFIDWVETEQRENAIVSDGIFGPKSIISHYESLGEVENTIYLKAKKYQEDKVKKAVVKDYNEKIAKGTVKKGDGGSGPKVAKDNKAVVGDKTSENDKKAETKNALGPKEDDIHFTIRDFAIKINPKTKIPTVDSAIVAKIKEEGMHFDNRKDSALELDITDLSINIQEVKVGETKQYHVSCTTSAIVADIPSDATTAYKYYYGDVLTKTTNVLYNGTNESTTMLQDAFTERENNLLFDNETKGKKYLRTSIQNKLISFDNFTAKAHFVKNGENIYTLTLTVVEVKKKGSFIVLNDKKIVLTKGEKLVYNLRVDGVK